MCLNVALSFLLPSSFTGVIRIGERGDSKRIAICVVSITPRLSRKYSELRPIILSSHSILPTSVIFHSQI